jgi:hypothetical protein
MNLAQTCFGTPAGGLEGRLDQAAELGFRGLAALDPADLDGVLLDAFPSHLHGRVPAVAWASFLPLPDDDRAADSYSSTDPEIWQRATSVWPSVFAGLRALNTGTLILDPGFQQATGAQGRGEKLLMALGESGATDPGSEALEPLSSPDAGETERQLEAFARFAHGLYQKAPGLTIAIRPEASPAGLLRPSHLNLLRNDAGLEWLGYWHDCGTAQTRAAFGLDQPGDWLDAAGAAVVGVTLQDWAEGRDLLLPGEGQVDFQLLAEYLPQTSIRVLAAAPVYPMGSLPAARETLAAFGIR